MKGNVKMKKMPYTLIFLFLLIIAVLAGCMKFSKSLPGNETEAEDGTAASVGQQQTAAYDPVAEASEIVRELEAQTDEAGVTVYSPEEISAFIESELVTDEPVTQAAAPVTDAAGSTVTATTNSGTPATTAKSGTPATTASSTPSTTAVSPPTSTAAQQPAAQTGVNEYDVLRSGVFYCVGSMKDSEGNNPMEIAITANSIYMATKMENVDMSLLQKDGKIYMIYPAGKIYLEVNSAIQKLVGLDADEMLNAESLGFSEMQPLSAADSVADGELNGTACKIYTFNKTSGARTVVYMNGNRLLAFENIDSSGSRATTYITSITGNVPADKCSTPADYEKVNLLKFMTAMGNVM